MQWVTHDRRFLTTVCAFSQAAWRGLTSAFSYQFLGVAARAFVSRTIAVMSSLSPAPSRRRRWRLTSFASLAAARQTSTSGASRTKRVERRDNFARLLIFELIDISGWRREQFRGSQRSFEHGGVESGISSPGDDPYIY
jgi:hypothetical protein